MSTLHKGGSRTPDVFIAVPAYGGIVADFARSLYESALLLERNGINAQVEIYDGNCHVDDSRNYLVREFLESTAKTFVFLDADLGWSGNDLLELIMTDRPVVAGIYPLKQSPLEYPVHTRPGEIRSDDEGFVEAIAVPTGFLKIQREVLEALDGKAIHHKLKTDPFERRGIPIIFERTVQQNTRWGGDYTFCLKAIGAGYKLYVKPSWLFSHYGTEKWSGTVGSWWREKFGGNEALLKNSFVEIGKGNLAQAAYDLPRAWGNQTFVALPSLIAAACELGKAHKPVLELGSGVTSLAMAAAGIEVHALEHSPIWATHLETQASELLSADQRKNLHLHFAPLKDYGDYEWYDFDPKGRWGMVVCDGPPRQTKGGRLGVERVLPYLDGPLLLDDTDSGNWFMDLPMDWKRLDERMSIGYHSAKRH